MSAPQIYYKPSKTAHWITNHSNGIVKTERQANYILIIVSVIFLIITVFIAYQLAAGNRPHLSQEELDSLLLQTLE